MDSAGEYRPVKRQRIVSGESENGEDHSDGVGEGQDFESSEIRNVIDGCKGKEAIPAENDLSYAEVSKSGQDESKSQHNELSQSHEDTRSTTSRQQQDQQKMSMIQDQDKESRMKVEQEEHIKQEPVEIRVYDHIPQKPQGENLKDGARKESQELRGDIKQEVKEEHHDQDSNHSAGIKTDDIATGPNPTQKESPKKPKKMMGKYFKTSPFPSVQDCRLWIRKQMDKHSKKNNEQLALQLYSHKTAEVWQDMLDQLNIHVQGDKKALCRALIDNLFPVVVAVEHHWDTNASTFEFRVAYSNGQRVSLRGVDAELLYLNNTNLMTKYAATLSEENRATFLQWVRENKLPKPDI